MKKTETKHVWENKIPSNVEYLIGIDCGTHTGLASWNMAKQEFVSIETLALHRAFDKVKSFFETVSTNTLVFIESPKTFVPFKGNKAVASRIQGAGSIKRDFAAWEDFFNDYKITFIPTSVIGGKKKVNAEMFAQITGVKYRTSEHARDAALIIFKRKTF
jgi:hypothetical protein